MNRQDWTDLGIALIFISFIFGVFIYGDYVREKADNRNYGCYIYHVQECLDCQRQNLTYLLCSGFCVKPSSQDLDGKGCPVIHPTKNCFDLPKECNL